MSYNIPRQKSTRHHNSRVIFLLQICICFLQYARSSLKSTVHRNNKIHSRFHPEIPKSGNFRQNKISALQFYYFLCILRLFLYYCLQNCLTRSKHQLIHIIRANTPNTLQTYWQTLANCRVLHNICTFEHN